MSHFAKIGENNIVLEVLYMETSVSSTEGGIEDESVGLAHLRTHHGHDNWKRCSYNSRGGQHYAIDSNGDYVPDGTPGYRANYPSEGWFWDETNEIFCEPRPNDKDGEPCASWTMNTTTGLYDAPLTRPTPTQEEDDARKVWRWDESLYQSDNTKGWLLVDQG